MTNNEMTIVRNIEDQNGTGDMKIIEWNVSDPTDSLYAVVTPVKMK
ncbi:hypothetical protein [Pseudoneobacillus sp. C159]